LRKLRLRLVNQNDSFVEGRPVLKPRVRTAIALGAVLLLAAVARGQRVEFPSPAASYAAAYQPPPTTFDPYALPSGSDPLAAPALAPGASPYAAGPYTPYAAPATAAPYSGAPGALYPEGVPVYNGPTFAPITDTWTKTMRFLQEVHADNTWLARGGGTHALGVDTTNAWVTFAVPFYWNANPLLVTPGFQLYLWDGPDPVGVPAGFGPDLPNATYGAYIDAAWNPQINNWLGAELEVSPGLYTDFQHTTTQSIRVLGRGLGVLTLTPTLQFKLGIWYIDRLKIKLLPAGGIVWTPNPDARYEIFFPAPKLARRCTTIGNHNIWAYIRGEYGGGDWTIQRPGLFNDQFDYNDLRFAIGTDFLPETQNGLRGYLEVGYAFDRQLVFRSGLPGTFNLTDTLLVAGGFSF
jgi:hypothetical protein